MTRTGTRLKTRAFARCLTVLGTGLLCRAAEPCAQGAAAGSNRVATATAAERAGRLAEAAADYEALLAADNAHAAVLAPRLVGLYTALNRPERALAWAHKVMAGRPDPEAYFAGVLAQLGQLKEAELLLRNTLRDASAPQRRVPLLWQLADVQERQGRREAALQTLLSAHDASQGTALQAAAAARLDACRTRPESKNTHGQVTLSQEDVKP